MIKKIAKWLATWLIGYLPDVVVWALELGTDKARGSAKAQRVLTAIESIAEDANAVAKAMKDGKITIEEAEAIRNRTKALTEEIKLLLKD